MTSIQNFTKQEEQKMSGWNKLIGNYPKVAPTYTYATQPQNKPIPEQTIIKPSWGPRIFALFATTFLTLLSVLFLTIGLLFGDYFAIPFGLSFIAIAYLLIYNTFFNKKYAFNLKLDKTGISINETNIAWPEIEGTYIMSKMGSKHTYYYLVIFKNDKTVEQFDLRIISESARKIATLIEYYKLQWRTSEIINQKL